MAGHEDVDLRPFFPSGPANTFSAQTVNIAATSASANVALNLPTNQGDQEIPSTCRVVNSGPNIAFIEFGTGGSVAAATATGIPLLPNSEKTFLLPKGIDHAAAILVAASGNTVYFTCGHGT